MNTTAAPGSLATPPAQHSGDASTAVGTNTIGPVATVGGPVLGVLEHADGGPPLQVFRGIPYAAPPVGDLRFRPPQPHACWSTPRQAFTFGMAALQARVSLLGPVGPMGEDCLTLNVWAPTTPGPHPVLFWCHGGGNIAGCSNNPAYDGAGFARQGVVFVSANYRLGALGFMELGSKLPGYAGSSLNGLHDLVMALRWVRDSIANFGGDPARVALMGESAGGKNITALLAMPEAQGLFDRAAIQSGGGHTVYRDAREAAPALAAILEGCGSSTAPEALLTLPEKVLMKAQAALVARPGLGFPFRPMVDGNTLPLRPIDAVRAGAARGVELVIGTCRDESAFYLPPAIINEPFQQRQVANLDIATMREVMERYATLHPGLPHAARAIRALTAEEYWIPCLRLAEAQAAAGGTARMYRFDVPMQMPPFQGLVPHGSDIPYIFGNPLPAALAAPPSAEEAALMATIHGFWARWARREAPLPGQAWPAYSTTDRRTLMLADAITLRDDPERADRALWEGLLEPAAP